MFDPISARLASSFSRNGISDAATETSCLGDTSMNWMLSRGDQDEVARLTRVDAVLGQLAVVVHGGVRLRDDVLVLFPGGQVEGIGLDLDALLLRPPFLVHHLVGFDDVAGLVLRAGGVGDDDVVGDPSVLDLCR